MNNRISVICQAYNHEKYIKYFIESILNQTIQDFELIIVDDCSTDNTVAEIKKFNDSRIKLLQHTFNQGVNYTMTDGIKAASSDILAFCASDDMLAPNYIEVILNKYNESPDISAIFVSSEIIDENNFKTGEKILVDNTIPQEEVLRISFISKNEIPSPGFSVKKNVIQKFLPLPYGLVQHQDWNIINKLLINSKVAFLNKPLCLYRRVPNSLSKFTDKMISREYLETDFSMDAFLEIKDLDYFKNIFKNLYEEYGEPIVETIPYFLSRIALKSEILSKRHWGYKNLLKFISKDNNFDLLHNLYNFSFKDFIDLAPIANNNWEKIDKKYKKYKNLYNIFLILFIVMTIILSIFLIRSFL